MKDGAVLSLAQLLAAQPAAPPPGWIEPGLLPAQGILFVGGEPKVGKSLLVANLALALAAGQDRCAFSSVMPRRWGRGCSSCNRSRYGFLRPAPPATLARAEGSNPRM